MNTDLKVGIAGHGVVGKIRRKILNSIPGLKIVAISDANPRNKILSKEVKFFDNYNKLYNFKLYGQKRSSLSDNKRIKI